VLLHQPWFSYLSTGRLTRFALPSTGPGPHVGDTILFHLADEATHEELQVAAVVSATTLWGSLVEWLRELSESGTLGTALPGIDSIELCAAIYRGFFADDSAQLDDGVIGLVLSHDLPGVLQFPSNGCTAQGSVFIWPANREASPRFERQ
jgi:hypothetical protein